MSVALVLAATLLRTAPCQAADEHDLNATSTSADNEVPTAPCTDKRECGNDVLTGGLVALEGGYSFTQADGERIGGVSRPIPISFRVEVELWKRWAIGIGYGALFFNDDDPIRAELVSCDKYTQECGDPYSEKSNVWGDFMTFETGYHHDFKLSKTVALMPGAHVGYLQTIFPITREVTCEDCPDGKPINFDTSGPYAGGSMQLNLGESGPKAAVGLRAMWHFQSDLYQTTTFFFGMFGG